MLKAQVSSFISSKPSRRVRQIAVNTVASVIALTFPVVSAQASLPPTPNTPPPVSSLEVIAFMETTEIPEIYEHLPNDPSVAGGIVDILDEIEKTISEIRESPETLMYLQEELSTLRND